MNRILYSTTALLALALLTGCPTDRNGDGKVTVACVGDSNTVKQWPMLNDPTTRWCERVAAQYPGWTFKNYGMIGASTHEVTPGFPPQTDARTQVAAAVVDKADMVLIALTTNDVRVWNRTPVEVVAGYSTLLAMIPAGIPVGLIAPPPAEPEFTPAIVDAWNAVVSAWPSQRIDPVVPADGMMADGVHLNNTGQAARATAVTTWLLYH